MTTRSRIAYYILAGLLGGAGAGGLMALLSFLVPETRDVVALRDALQGAIIGVFIGLYLGAIEGITHHEPARAVKGAVVSATGGLLGGTMGVMTGGTIFRGMAGLLVNLFPGAAQGSVTLGLSLGWCVLGAGLGASSGLLIRSRTKARHGLIGGAAGGILGGLAFFAFYDRQSFFAACLGLSLLGGAIGMGIALVEDLLAGIVFRVKKGRHQGREYPIYRPTATIGRDDRCDVCLSGAEGVSLVHARVKRNGAGLIIEDESPEIGIYVNDSRTKRASLRVGDVIRVGSVLLELKKGLKKGGAAAAMAIMTLCLAGPAPSSADDLSVRISQFDTSGYPHVRAYISILSKNGAPVPGMAPSRVSIRENGLALPVEGFVPARDDRGQFSAALVLDRSGSMSGEKMKNAKASVETFIRLMEPNDQAVLLPFSDRVDTTGFLTKDKDGVIRALAGIEADGHTALYDAVIAGVEKVRMQHGRRAAIVLTDGKANRGASDIEQAIQAGVRGDTSIYVIGLGEDVRTERLERISHSTGGQYYFTPSPDDLRAIYESISRQIKGEYVLSYHGPDTGEYIRTLDIMLSGGGRASRPYFQPSSSLFGASSGTRHEMFWPISLILFTALVLGGAGLRTVEHDKVCPSCGKEVRARAKFCPSCGGRFSA